MEIVETSLAGVLLIKPRVLGDPRGPIAYEFARIGGAVRRWLAERDQDLSQAA